MDDPVLIARFSKTLAATLLALSCAGARTQGDAGPVPASPADPDAKETTPAERLASCRKLYGSLRTYQDTGEVQSRIDTGEVVITDTKPFSTAFERDGRFRWEFRGSSGPGRKADTRYVVWSTDNETYHSWWELSRERGQSDSLGTAMEGSTGVSGGSTTAIVPLLRTDIDVAARTTDLRDPVKKGTAEIDGVKCHVIEGKGLEIQGVTGLVTRLWIDDSMAIRRIEETKVVVPNAIPGSASGGGPVKVQTIIIIKPILNQAIQPEAFDPGLPP
jgi:hypothetical protein